MLSMLRIFPAFIPALVLFGAGCLSAFEQADGVAEFQKDILPILEDNCLWNSISTTMAATASAIARTTTARYMAGWTASMNGC